MDDPFLSSQHDQVGGIPEVLGPWQLDLLREVGLESGHRVLDLGCGTLRGGLHLIGFLDAGQYFGADPNESLLDVGRRLLREAGLSNKRPSVGDLEWVDQLADASFDFVLTQSVLNHLDETGILELMERVHSKLAPEGAWTGTARFSSDVDDLAFSEPHPARPNEYVNTTMHPDWFASQLAQCAFTLDFDVPLEHPRGLTPFRVRRSSHPRSANARR